MKSNVKTFTQQCQPPDTYAQVAAPTPARLALEAAGFGLANDDDPELSALDALIGDLDTLVQSIPDDCDACVRTCGTLSRLLTRARALREHHARLGSVKKPIGPKNLKKRVARLNTKILDVEAFLSNAYVALSARVRKLEEAGAK